jgi:hypothetical protein
MMKPIYISIVHLRSQTNEEPNKQRLSLLSDFSPSVLHCQHCYKRKDTDRNSDALPKMSGEEATVVRKVGRETRHLIGTDPLFIRHPRIAFAVHLLYTVSYAAADADCATRVHQVMAAVTCNTVVMQGTSFSTKHVATTEM